ncbi:hypothetical protein [Paraburkholderia heleia]|uniref:hypothetical protein n=1 Tax=Paraburkholderia heleia TaxID=634127 RepID=UPI002AB705FD|nr:hypothetical protein [Paraburkholderia heleia]
MGTTSRSYLDLAKFIFSSLILSGCSTVNYDSQADQQLTTITQEINLQLTTWEHQAEKTPVAYDTSFYDKTESDISSLEIRMESVQSPATDKLVSYFESLNNQLEEMRSQHKKPAPLPTTYFHAERLILDEQLAVLTTFELSLKNSSSSNTESTSSTATTTTAKKASGVQK